MLLSSYPPPHALIPWNVHYSGFASANYNFGIRGEHWFEGSISESALHALRRRGEGIRQSIFRYVKYTTLWHMMVACQENRYIEAGPRKSLH